MLRAFGIEVFLHLLGEAFDGQGLVVFGLVEPFAGGVLAHVQGLGQRADHFIPHQ